MSVKFIAGNWKLNPPDLTATLDLTRRLKARLAPFSRTRIAVCPPFVTIPAVVELLKETHIAVGGQNLFWEDSGAYTGEISAPLLKSAGCRYVIIGHSERRRYFGESNENVREKIRAALKQDLKPILCVGETLAEREAGVLKDVIREQVTEALREMDAASLKELVVAYEPVWAIGTGKTASPAQAQEMHHFIRQLLTEMFSPEFADAVFILYGGSVKPDNAAELLRQPDINGALVGGASLDAEAFTAIVQSAEQSN